MKVLKERIRSAISPQLQERLRSVKWRAMNLLRELYREWTPYPPTAERRSAPGFVIYHPAASAPVPRPIKNISSTGVYLCTEERWPPGAVVPLTLQRVGPPEEDPEQRVTLKARVIRWGQDGVGFAFALPEDMNFDLWHCVIESIPEQQDSDDILAVFRMAEATAFLNRICPTAISEIRELICTGLGNARAANAIEIALEAELFLASEPHAELMRADPEVVRRIIEAGSWTDERWIKHLWAGLLTTYCTAGENVDSDPDLVDRFSQLAPVHVSLFKAACTRAAKVVSGAGVVSARPLVCTIRDIQNITGIQSLAKIERDIHHLAYLGLIEQGRRSQSLFPAEEAAITPSTYGLTLYARCYGHRGAPRDFYSSSRGSEECQPELT